ncbi:hypothetical protein GYMLUDRAFT_64264 [Collybiopsis luxurians FD-317 M1]|uniref:F-box domain-containing protein n=1 Tax=Collybiopsis luxurians FD-317 M1 TaxID=944289 RepID=A0A0D0CC01_9AGAR|nr:hypothetical protein GYMLUDRAFT_64264 [Collybiopsis luxurians FD-317 M1]
MRLFEMTEQQHRWAYRKAKLAEEGIIDIPYELSWDLDEAEVTLTVDGESTPTEDPDFYRVFQFDRFFATIRGFLERLDELEPLWATFTKAFTALKKMVSASTVEVVDGAGTKFRRETYTVDEEVWVSFRSRWKIARAISVNDLVHAAEILDLLPHRERKIQALCLTNLPNELIDHIMSLALPSQTRMLSATCKHLRQIGLLYLFEGGFLDLQRNSVCYYLALDEEILEQQLISDARQSFLGRVDFFLSHPNIARRMHQLSLMNGYGYHTAIPSTYYTPVHAAVLETLNAVENLRQLEITEYTLEPESFTAIAHLSHLRRLSFTCCRYSDSLVSSVRSLPKCQHIEAVSLKYYEDRNENVPEGFCWFMLGLFPHIRVLNMLEHLDTAPPLPQMNHLRLFSQLRCLSLFEFYGLRQLADLIRADRSKGNLPLTHFKITFSFGQSDDEVKNLLEALDSVPLEALSIDGLKGAGLNIISDITEHFPNLRALSLVRRENDIQVKASPCAWPHSPQKYAPFFARFTRLEYFYWNFEDVQIPLVSLMLFEQLALNEGKEDGLEKSEYWRLQGLINIAEWPPTCVDATGLLISYCPCLKIVDTPDRLSNWRAREGRERETWVLPQSPPDVKDQWNPSEAKGWSIDLVDVDLDSDS